MDAPEPSKRERIQIISMLADVYDLDAGMYSGGETDDTVASALEVMPGFVAIVRESEFGPAGGNEDMKALGVEMEAHINAGNEILKSCADAVSKMENHILRHQEYLDRLKKIEKAVGRRVMSRV
ncbi:hypothetical protein [Tateyamaria sp.]|uniref:hypothetical protein n=1 Tax=Tateyamaria sp. TaxID=1929288 RepID=UPI003B20F9D0